MVVVKGKDLFAQARYTRNLYISHSFSFHIWQDQEHPTLSPNLGAQQAMCPVAVGVGGKSFLN